VLLLEWVNDSTFRVKKFGIKKGLLHVEVIVKEGDDVGAIRNYVLKDIESNGVSIARGKFVLLQ
jgi:hypothetical protein